VISNAAIELYEQIPTAKAKPATTQASAPAAAVAPAAAGSMTDGIMFAMGHHLETHPELAKSIQTIYQWKLSSPDSQYVLDVKNGVGSCKKGTVDKPDVTLELSDADFVAMATGQADAQKLYFGGKLKIGGNVMASQKLDFLKKIDRDAAMKAYQAKHGGGGAAAASPAPAAAAAPAASASMTDGIMFAMGHHLETHPELAAKIQTIFQWKLSNPDSQYVLDAKNGVGSCKQGTVEKPDCTFELSDADFIAMATGQADPQKLYFGGKLKIGGNVMASQKLDFLKKIDRDAAMKAYTAKQASGGAAAAAPQAAAAPKTSRAPAILAALKTKGGGDLAAPIQFTVKNPDFEFYVDAKSAGEGKAKDAKTTVKLDEDDLVAIAKGADLQDLYQHGKLRVDGDVLAAHKLGFLKNVL
jgi:3-hydroxyacyl-CoA dehydrogenase/3a,7a,12a-trihydroxy-5b-cholest-24-enoyl-CoA hydratase